MAQITNPEAVRFVNEVVLALAERVRGLKVQLDAAATAWFGGLSTHFVNGADTVEDGREGEGVSRLTAADVTNAMTQFLKTASGQAGAWNPEVIQRPCVRQLP